MVTHAPAGYECPFCALVAGTGHLGKNPPSSTPDDIFYRNDHITALIASHWWPNNPGHVIIIPNRHIEHIYDLTPDIAVHVHEAARQVAIAFKQVYGCDGTSTRQHNEPAGYQEVFHYHLHVFPRWHNDYLYDLTFQKALVSPERRQPYAEKLRRYFAENGGTS